MVSILGLCGIFLSVVLVLFLGIIFIKNLKLKLSLLIFLIPICIIYTYNISLIPSVYEGRSKYLNSLYDLPDQTIILKSVSDYKNYLAVWVIKPGENTPFSYWVKFDEKLFKKISKKQQQKEQTNGVMVISKGGRKGKKKDGKGRSVYNPDSRDIIVKNPRDVLTKHEE